MPFLRSGKPKRMSGIPFMPSAIQGSVEDLASDASHRWSYPSAGRASYIPCEKSPERAGVAVITVTSGVL